MKHLTKICFLTIIIATACNPDEDVILEENKVSYFLSEIRPAFFDYLNFNSPENIARIPDFLEDFGNTYQKLEDDYESGLFVSTSDRDNMRIAGMYYSFAITATVRAYLDGFIEFEDIIGNQTIGPFSDLPVTSADFEQKELEAMMTRSRGAAYFAMNVNGFNDKTYGTYMVSKQITGRVASPKHFNNPATQDSMIQYIDSRIEDYQLFSEWNVLMSQLSFTNYKDSLNTFKNPKMNTVLDNINQRLVIGAIPDLNGRYAEIIGPIFRMDLNMKKVDWLLDQDSMVTDEKLEELDGYLKTIENLGNYISNDKGLLLNAWDYKETFTMRLDKLEELKQYKANMKNGRSAMQKPALEGFFTSKDFLQAYQCYNCHKQVEL